MYHCIRPKEEGADDDYLGLSKPWHSLCNVKLAGSVFQGTARSRLSPGDLGSVAQALL